MTLAFAGASTSRGNGEFLSDEDPKCEATHRKNDESDERAEWLMIS